MSNKANTDHQYALVTWLAKEFGNQGSLGKKALQKLVYILEEAMNVETGYSFQLYTYGPFSRDLAGDIDILDTQSAIRVMYIDAENRYVVSESRNTDKYISNGSSFIEENNPKLLILRDWFATKTARELELFSTLHYLIRNNPLDLNDSIVEKLISIKPKYSTEETARCLSRVKEFNELMQPKPKAA